MDFICFDMSDFCFTNKRLIEIFGEDFYFDGNLLMRRKEVWSLTKRRRVNESNLVGCRTQVVYLFLSSKEYDIVKKAKDLRLPEKKPKRPV